MEISTVHVCIRTDTYTYRKMAMLFLCYDYRKNCFGLTVTKE